MREILHARWDEIKHLDEIGGDALVIPASRMKAKAEHVVPLTDALKDIIFGKAQPDGTRQGGLPRFQGGIYLFSPGKRTLGGMGRGKELLDKAMRTIDPDQGHFVFHDLRRTARSLLSRAGVNADVAERVLAHTLTGVRGIYDRHKFEKEKLAALNALDLQVNLIVNPPADNVRQLRA